MAPLGYDNDREGRKIVVNEDEATQVRGTFELYLECQSIIQTIKEIDRRGWKNKLTVTKSGKERGGRHFDKSSLFKLLTNVAYVRPEAGDRRRETGGRSAFYSSLPSLACSMTTFDPIWESMTLRDQIRLVQVVIKQVDYDGESGRVTITFSTGYRLETGGWRYLG